MQVVRFNPILCCSILRNASHFFVSPTAIPVNRYPLNVILSGKPHLSPDKLFKINNLSVETYHLTDKLRSARWQCQADKRMIVNRMIFRMVAAVIQDDCPVSVGCAISADVAMVSLDGNDIFTKHSIDE